MAEVAALGPHHFVRAFKASVGVPPYAHLVRRRVERARHLLAHTDRRISRIAYDLGDSDPAHLTRQFKQHVGRTPSAFRRDAGR
jgi:AraC family transcriptional regulator